MSPPLIAVEGILGAGKSTFCSWMQAYLDEHGFGPCTVAREPVVTNPLLRGYYEDPKTYAGAFQLFMLARRVEAHAEAQRSARPTLLDRTLIGDYAFFELHRRRGNIAREETLAYVRSYRLAVEELYAPRLVVMLDVSPPAAQRRIAQRGRKEESRIGWHYVQEAIDAYESTLADVASGRHPWGDDQGTKIVRLRWDGPQADDWAFAAQAIAEALRPGAVIDPERHRVVMWEGMPLTPSELTAWVSEGRAPSRGKP